MGSVINWKPNYSSSRRKKEREKRKSNNQSIISHYINEIHHGIDLRVS